MGRVMWLVGVAMIMVIVQGDIWEKTMFTEQDGYWQTPACTKMVVANNGEVFCGDKRGKVVKFPSMDVASQNAAVTIWENEPGMTTSWEDRGLLGMAVDPNYPDTPYIYVFLSYNTLSTVPASKTKVLTDPAVCKATDLNAIDGSCDAAARLLRIKVTNDVGVTDQILADDWCANGGSHHLGNIAFARDGGLFVSAGDGASFSVADRGNAGNKCYRAADTRFQGVWRSQWDDYLEGKIVHITKEDLVGNALLTLTKGLRIVAKGLRNPYRWLIHPITFDIYEGDVGQDDCEEINLIPDPLTATTVTNYGWPCYEGNLVQKWYGADVGCDLIPASAGKPWMTYTRNTGFPDVPGAVEHCKTGSVSSGGFAMQSTAVWGSAMQFRLIWADSSAECIFIFGNDANGLPLPDPKKVKLISYNPAVPHPAGAIPKMNKWCDLFITNGVLYAVNYDQSNVAAFKYIGPTVIDPNDKHPINGAPTLAPAPVKTTTKLPVPTPIKSTADSTAAKIAVATGAILIAAFVFA